jgi:hypothetical protein
MFYLASTKRARGRRKQNRATACADRHRTNESIPVVRRPAGNSARVVDIILAMLSFDNGRNTESK